jgi:hypothetical protein
VNSIPSSPSDSPGPTYAEGGVLPPTTVYLAICLPPGTMPGGLAEIQLAIAEAARKVTEAGHPVRYLNGMYMPAQTRLLCVFAAENEEAAHAAVDLVRLPYVQMRAITDRWDQGPAPAE